MRRRQFTVIAAAVALLATAAAVGAPTGPARAGTTALPHRWDVSAAGWNRSSSPTIADLFGNGSNEIVYGSQDGWVHVRDGNGNELPGWPQPAVIQGGATAVDSSPAVADLDNNGQKEIIVTVGSTWVPHQHGGLIVFNANGTVRWSYKADDRMNIWTNTPSPDGYADGMYSSPAVADVDGDGYPEIVAGGFDQEIHVFNRFGQQYLRNDPFWAYDTVWSSPAVFDVHGTGTADIFVGSDQSPGSPLNWAGGVVRDLTVQNGQLVERWHRFIGDVVTSSPVIGDIDGSGRVAVVVGSGDFYHNPDGRKVFAFYADDGSTVPGWPQATGGTTIGTPALADLEGNGHLDVIEGSGDGGVYAWRGNGSLLWRASLSWLNQPGGPIRAGAIVADVNGDGRQDVIVGNDGELYGLDGRTGAEIKTFDILWSYEASAAVGNFGAAGWQLIGAGFNTPNHTWHLFSVPLPAQSQPPGWPMFHHDATHSGSAEPSPTLSVFSSGNAGLAATTAYGGVRTGGTTPFKGDMSGRPLNGPVNGISRTKSGQGYWLVADDGGMFSFGDAPFYGSMGGHPLNQQMMGMAPTVSGHGYWTVARDGGIFAFGDAPFYGSMGGHPLNQPIVGMTPTPDDRGYWMVARDGGIFAFGDAPFYGSTGNLALTDITGMSALRSGHGYRFVSRSGHVYCFGDAKCYGDVAGKGYAIVGMQTTASGNGYWLLSDTGVVIPFGDADGGLSRLPGAAVPLVAISPY